MQNKTQRGFIIGNDWLYYKIYCGPKSSEAILTQIIAPIAKQLINDGIIQKWFFIRYEDPDFHLRVRFYYLEPDNIGLIINSLRPKLQLFFDQDIIAKVQIDTYQREIERYGSNSMDLSETLFFYDSEMISAFIALISGDDGEENRWLFSLLAIDSHLESFKFSLDEKQTLTNYLKSNYRNEFDKSKFLNKQLNDKYRKHRCKIEAFMDNTSDNDEKLTNYKKILEEKNQKVSSIVMNILNLKSLDTLQVDFNSLNSSYIHMLMNRLFKSKNRMHEMVVYDFLDRYYISKIAREKHSTINI